MERRCIIVMTVKMRGELQQSFVLFARKKGRSLDVFVMNVGMLCTDIKVFEGILHMRGLLFMKRLLFVWDLMDI